MNSLKYYKMKLSMTIRKALISDAPAIAKLSCQLGYPTTTSQASLRLANLYNKKDQTVLVADLEPQIVVGWIHIFGTQRVETDPFAEIGGLVVDEAYRNHGVGKQLLEAACLWAEDHGFRTVRVRSNIIRSDAHRFYQREGFQIAKTQVIFEINRHLTSREIPD